MPWRHRNGSARGFAVAVALVAASASLTTSPGAAAAANPAIKHVWVITLENESADSSFGANSPATYLNKTLRPLGVYLEQYYGTGHLSLDNYVAMVSGQGANMITQADCPLYIDVVPGLVGPDGQASGEGCVYPKAVLTIADQLEAKGLTWKGYMQDMGNDPSREAATCAHPDLNTPDNTESATATDSYATRHNPFMYFHSIIDEPSCNTNVVPLPPLATDLASAATTPNFSFITPSLCDDGHDAPCADGRPGGLVSADLFLSTWVPKILGSPAYADGGMLVVNFDESESDDATACCGERPNPGGSPKPGISGPGGGRTGAVVVSPFIAPNTISTVGYNHYSLLRSLEDVFGLSHLGFAAAEGLAPFGLDVYSGTAPTTQAPRAAPTPAAPVNRRALPRTGGGDALVGLLVLGGALLLVRVRHAAVAVRGDFCGVGLARRDAS